MMALDFEYGDEGQFAPTLGLVVLQTDEVIEREFREITKTTNCSLFHSRVPSDPTVTSETLAQMALDIPASVELLPSTLGFDVIGYACTSGATVIGEEKVAELIRSVRPGVATSNPLSAVKAALSTLNIRRLGFVTPYVAEVSLAMRAALEEDGFEISGFGSFEQSEEHLVARISAKSILDAIINIGESTECEAVFVACTNLRTFDILATAERQIGKPVISSTQALAWHMLRLAGSSASPDHLGELFERDLVDG